MDPANRVCPKCHSPLPPNTDKCPKCDSTPPGCSIGIAFFFWLLLSGTCAWLGSLFTLRHVAPLHLIKELQGFESVFNTAAVITALIITILAILITYLSHRRYFVEYLNTPKAFLPMLLTWLISAGAGVLIGGPFHAALRQRFVTEANQRLWEHCRAYDHSKDVSVFKPPATQTRYYELAVARYLLADKHPIYVEAHKRLLERAKEIVEIGQQYTDDYRLEEEYRLIDPDLGQSGAVFNGLTFADMADYTYHIRSLVYITYTNNIVGYYTPTGEKAIQTIADVHVIDLRRKGMSAVYHVAGGMPSRKVSSANLFSSTSGSSPSLKEIENRYHDLPLKE